MAAPSGSSLTPATAGPASIRYPPLPGTDVIGEVAHDPRHVLEPVPAGNLDHHRIIRAGAGFTGDDRRLGDGIHVTVAAYEPGGHVWCGTVEYAEFDEDGPHGGGIEVLVRRGERVDRRRDDRHLPIGGATTARSPGARIRTPPPSPGAAAGSPIPPGWRHSPSRHRCGSATPPGRQPALAARLGRGLWVVQQCDIVRPDLAEQLHRVCGQHPRVMIGLCWA
jgi:hypothetical protein